MPRAVSGFMLAVTFVALLSLGCTEKKKMELPLPEDIPDPTPKQIEQCIIMLGRDAMNKRLLAVKRLAKFGTKSKDAIPILEKMLEEPDEQNTEIIAAIKEALPIIKGEVTVDDDSGG